MKQGFNSQCFGNFKHHVYCLKCKLINKCLGIKESNAKYHNEKTEVDGIEFHSRKEANRYCELKMLKAARVIKDFKMQVVYLLQEAFRKNGKLHREITYVADFVVTYPDEHIEVEDTKGYRTRTYLDKRKMFEKRYPDLTIKEL